MVSLIDWTCLEKARDKEVSSPGLVVSFFWWSRARAWIWTKAWTRSKVMIARLRTLWPLTRACSFTTPCRALNAVRALSYKSSKSNLVSLKWYMGKKHKGYTSKYWFYQASSESCLNENSSNVSFKVDRRPTEKDGFLSRRRCSFLRFLCRNHVNSRRVNVADVS